MRRRALAVVAAALLVGCGGETEGAAGHDEPDEIEATPSTPVPPTEAPAKAPPSAPWRHLAAHLPDAVGGFTATSDVEENQATTDGLPLASAERRYQKDERELVIRIIDTRDAPHLQVAFREVRQLNFDTLDELARPTEVAGSPALLQWSRRTGESEVQVMVASKYILTVRVWPADTKAEALGVVEAFELDGLARTL